jgi:uncharacterized OB-fold protein
MSDRPSPAITELTAPFWRGGASGELRIQRCATCGRFQHPPQPMCPHCHGRALGAEAVSGRGTVWSYTVNRYPWAPGIEPPYVLAEVELAEQPGLRLLTAITDVDPDGDPPQVSIGMPVRVHFEQAGEAWIPVFAPEAR